MTDQPSLLDRLKQLNKGATESPKNAITPPPANGQGFDADGVAQRMRDLGQGDGINPPEGAVPEQEGAQAAPQAPPKLGPMPPPPGEQGGAQAASVASEGRKSPCPHCGRGYKHLAKHRCKLAPAVETPPEVGSPPPEEKIEGAPEAAPTVSPPTEEKIDEKAPKKPSGYLLLIDAVYEAADGSEVVRYFGDVIRPFCEAVARENGVAWWSVVEYAKGPGFLAAKLDAALSKHGLDGVLIVDGGSAEGKACKEVLRRHARAVIQGVR